MSQFLNKANWNRAPHFDFFRSYEIPFFNICVKVDVQSMLNWCRESEQSFFIASLFYALKAANAIPEFRYRLRDDKVLIHDIIHAGSTVLNEDETFSFCYFDFSADYQTFAANSRRVLEQNRQSTGKLESHADHDDLIHFSVIPWIHFTSIAHPMKLRDGDSIPKIVFGKREPKGDKCLMPVSVQVHHALMDGLQVANFLSNFEKLLADPKLVLGEN